MMSFAGDIILIECNYTENLLKGARKMKTYAQIKKDVSNIIDQYWVEEKNFGYYTDMRTIGKKALFLIDEVSDYLRKNEVQYRVDEEYTDDIPMYSYKFTSFAFIAPDEDGKAQLGLETVLLNCG